MTALQGPPQCPALANELLVAYHLVERPGAHPRRQRLAAPRWHEGRLLIAGFARSRAVGASRCHVAIVQSDRRVGRGRLRVGPAGRQRRLLYGVNVVDAAAMHGRVLGLYDSAWHGEVVRPPSSPKRVQSGRAAPAVARRGHSRHRPGEGGPGPNRRDRRARRCRLAGLLPVALEPALRRDVGRSARRVCRQAAVVDHAVATEPARSSSGSVRPAHFRRRAQCRVPVPVAAEGRAQGSSLLDRPTGRWRQRRSVRRRHGHRDDPRSAGRQGDGGDGVALREAPRAATGPRHRPSERSGRVRQPRRHRDVWRE